jgi:hypothetical protein
VYYITAGASSVACLTLGGDTPTVELLSNELETIEMICLRGPYLAAAGRTKAVLYRVDT